MISCFLCRPIVSRRGCSQAVFLIALIVEVWWAQSFSVERRRLPGIWKLRSDILPHQPDIRSKLKGIIDQGESTEDEIWIKLNPDGSFKQCNEGYNEGRWLSGWWDLDEDNNDNLCLALRRQYYGPPFDIVLEGKIQEKGVLLVQGTVCQGKFMYPPKHPSFLDPPRLINRQVLGPFTMEQSLGSLSMEITPSESSSPLDDDAENSKEEKVLKRHDFFGKAFILTVGPIEGRKQQVPDDALNLPVHILSMPIQFFRNNTFQARGINKILRGRFDVNSDENKGTSTQLTFSVSRFGIGRSISGSVYSEGPGLTHEDERSYVGSVERLDDGSNRIEGTVFFGADLGSDARPEPIGKFWLTEDTAPSSVSSEKASWSSPQTFFEIADDDLGVFE